MRDTAVTNKLKPYLNILTSELQNAYMGGRSAIDIFYLLNIRFNYEDANQLILLGLSAASDSVNREILRAVLYGRRLSISLIKVSRMEHQGTKLRP